MKLGQRHKTVELDEFLSSIEIQTSPSLPPPMNSTLLASGSYRGYPLDSAVERDVETKEWYLPTR
jgi:hypothetical protein